MPSSLSWIDFDSDAQQRAQRILTLFKDRDTRDELGLGPIRDAISDTLFPGTSTIQTRLRYMLFVPWIYSELENSHVASAKSQKKSRQQQLKLARALKENCPRELGIIGGDVGDKLKTLPSAIYWAGLGRWGLRVYPGTEGQYQRALDAVYRRRRRSQASVSAAAEDGDDIGGLWELGAYTFHPGLPVAPSDFPNGVTFDLSRAEARYLQERVRQSCRGSLLADLLAKPSAVSVSAPWEHPYVSGFRREHRALLRHGKLFSMIAQGAAILYNLMLAQILEDAHRIDRITEAGHTWGDQLIKNATELEIWADSLTEFWETVEDRGHDISAGAREFVEHWVMLALSHEDGVFTSSEARRLVRAREIEKKKANSRFTNARVRDQWGGRSGMRRMVFRWPLVESYVADMARAVR